MKQKQLNISIVSFDEFGISRHPNHIATHEGLKVFCSQKRQSLLKDKNLNVRCFELETTNLFRKYFGIFDVVLSVTLALGSNDQLFLLTNFFKSLQAMQSHRSQLVWFRFLFVLLSRYSYVNTLKEIN